MPVQGAVTATITVQFGDGGNAGAGANGHLSAEIDPRVNGLNAGKTSFEPGEPVHILVYKSANVSISNVLVSAGSVYPGANQSIQREDFLTFNNSKTADLSKPSAGSVAGTWFGQSLGAVVLSANQTTLTAGRKGVAVGKFVYTSQPVSYRLSTPIKLAGETNFTIAVVIIGTVN